MEMLLDFQDACSTDAKIKELLEQCTVDPTTIPPKDAIQNGDSSSTALDYNPEYLAAILRMPDKAFELKDVITADESGNPAITDAGPSDYFDPEYEEEYLTNLDEQLANSELFLDPNKTLEKPRSRVLPSDKELSNQNVDSVVSWLRRNHPETFIQEKDPAEAKPEKKPRGSTKRATGAQAAKAEIKPEPEPEGEEEAGEDGADKWKGRKHRANKEDEAYRPKGGSSRGSKRKREDGDPKGRGGKRSKSQATAAT
jgi:IEC3 subunit of the Ino80 complex involved in chromatin re-modelling